jgi:hypothetical protein
MQGVKSVTGQCNSCPTRRIELSAGDIVLFSGSTPIRRRVQTLMQSPWSQVGLVFVLPDYSEPLLLEATSVALCPDVETGLCRPGICMSYLLPRIHIFEGVVAARKLDPPLTSQLIRELVHFRRAVCGSSYDFSRLSARNSFRRAHVVWNPNLLICSSLVAFAYQSIGIMARPPIGPIPCNVLPGDFAPGGAVHLVGGYSFDPRRRPGRSTADSGLPR